MSDSKYFTYPDVWSLYSILKEVSVLLEALEKRQIELERENKQLKEDLTGAIRLIEEGDNARKILEKQLTEKEEQLAEKKDIVFVEHEHSKWAFLTYGAIDKWDIQTNQNLPPEAVWRTLPLRTMGTRYIGIYLIDSENIPRNVKTPT